MTTTQLGWHTHVWAYQWVSDGTADTPPPGILKTCVLCGVAFRMDAAEYIPLAMPKEMEGTP